MFERVHAALTKVNHQYAASDAAKTPIQIKNRDSSQARLFAILLLVQTFLRYKKFKVIG